MNSVQSWFNVGLMLNALERPSLLKDLEVQLMIGDDQGLRSTTSILRGFQKFTNVCRIFNLPGSIVDLALLQGCPEVSFAETGRVRTQVPVRFPQFRYYSHRAVHFTIVSWLPSEN